MTGASLAALCRQEAETGDSSKFKNAISTHPCSKHILAVIEMGAREAAVWTRYSAEPGWVSWFNDVFQSVGIAWARAPIVPLPDAEHGLLKKALSEVIKARDVRALNKLRKALESITDAITDSYF
jgi:hypothetical protein